MLAISIFEQGNVEFLTKISRISTTISKANIGQCLVFSFSNVTKDQDNKHDAGPHKS